MAVAASQHFGIIGNGKLFILRQGKRKKKDFVGFRLFPFFNRRFHFGNF